MKIQYIFTVFIYVDLLINTVYFLVGKNVFIREFSFGLIVCLLYCLCEFKASKNFFF